MTTVTFRVGRKGSSKSGNYGHAGRLGKVGGSAPKAANIYPNVKTVDDVSQVRSYGGVGKAYIILGDDINPNYSGKIVDTNGSMEHVDYIAKSPPELFGMTDAEMESFANALKVGRTKKGRDDPEVSKAFIEGWDKAKASGAILVRLLGGQSSINTSKIDTPTLKRLQDAYGAGKIDMGAGKTHVWEAGKSGVAFTTEEFLSARTISQLNVKTFKEMIIQYRYKGSSKSGNYGHAGRPGKVGGSAPKSIGTGSYVAAKYQNLEDLPSYQHFVDNDFVNWTNGCQNRTDDGADGQLEAILHDQGFDGLPEIITPDQWGQYQKAGEVTVYRGLRSGEDAAELSLDGSIPTITAKEMEQQFKTGKLFAGWGSYGNGTYTTTSSKTANSYSGKGDNGAMIIMSIRKDAKVINMRDLQDLGERIRETNRKAKAPEGIKECLYDDGRMAAIKGYDAIRVTPSDRGEVGGNADTYYIVLNRTAVRVVGD